MSRLLAKTGFCVLLILLVSSVVGFAGETDGGETDLRPFKVAVDVQTAHCAPFIVADAKGWLAERGLEAVYTNYPHGIAAIEALPSGTWDFLTTAFPGWTPGSLRYNLKIIACGLWEQYNIGFFARPDHPVVLAGQGNIPGYPDLYGTAETWRGQNILLPTGTTLHLTLAALLDALDLTENDVEITGMDVPTAYTAFKAGNADILGSWTNFSLECWDDGLIMAAHQDAVFARTPGILTASEAIVESDPELVEDVIELYFDTWNWILDNQDEAAQIFLDYHIDTGYLMDIDTAKALFTQVRTFPFDEQLEKLGPGGEYQEIGKETFDFFVSIGRYEADAWDTLVNNFEPRFLENIVANQ